MFAKIVKIGIVGLLAATLVGGSAYVVLRPNEAQASQVKGGQDREQVSEAGGGKGYGNQCVPTQDVGGKGDGAQGTSSQGAGGGNGRGNSVAAAPSNSGGKGAGAAGESKGDGESYAATEWITVTGEVTSFVDDELTIQTPDGEVVMHLGPEWYWEVEGVALNLGDEVEVTGFYEGDEFEVAGVENLTTGESVVLRDDSGRPMWAGRGRRGS
ncbi:MAG: hypothetical protein JW918_04615 [Anaerolineae bacterium]|nr:hypothetical protein [Anaerolineae bacterium]